MSRSQTSPKKHYPSRPKKPPKGLWLNNFRRAWSSKSLLHNASMISFTRCRCFLGACKEGWFFVFFLDETGQEARLKERMVTCTSENGIKNIRHMVDTSENPLVEPVEFLRNFDLFTKRNFLWPSRISHWRHESMSSHRCCLNSVFLKTHHSYNKSSSFGEEEVLAIVAVWAVDAWCWWSVPGEHDAVFVFRGASILGMSLTILRLFRLHQNVGF